VEDQRFELSMKVIEAAKDGRFYHSNGVQHYIHTGAGPVWIDTHTCTLGLAPTYVGTPRRDPDFVRGMTNWLMVEELDQPWTSTTSYHVGHRMVKEAVQRNELLYSNGADWTIRLGYNVACINLAGADTCTIATYNMHRSWVYMAHNGSYRRILDEQTRRHMGF